MTKPKSHKAKEGKAREGKSKAAERSPSVAAAEAPPRPEASELERKRLAVAEELSNVERQVRWGDDWGSGGVVSSVTLPSSALGAVVTGRGRRRTRALAHALSLLARALPRRCLQIYDLETKYLEQSSPFGNAVRGGRPAAPAPAAGGRAARLLAGGWAPGAP